MRDLNEQELLEIETIIDRCGLSSILMGLSELCGRKAQHIAENWQDAKIAKDWATLEGAIGVVVPRATARGL